MILAHLFPHHGNACCRAAFGALLIATVAGLGACASPGPTSPGDTPATGAGTAGDAAACTTTDLGITVQRGTGVGAQQFAMLIFANTGRAACSLAGYPTVSLLVGGVGIGSAAQATAQPAVVTVPAGGSVSTRLVDDSTCSAPNSDTMLIVPPGDTVVAVTRPIVLRGCRLTLTPLAP